MSLADQTHCMKCGLLKATCCCNFFQGGGAVSPQPVSQAKLDSIAAQQKADDDRQWREYYKAVAVRYGHINTDAASQAGDEADVLLSEQKRRGR